MNITGGYVTRISNQFYTDGSIIGVMTATSGAYGYEFVQSTNNSVNFDTNFSSTNNKYQLVSFNASRSWTGVILFILQ